MADINSQVLEALNQGIGPQDIIDHLSSSENPERYHGKALFHLRWARNPYKVS